MSRPGLAQVSSFCLWPWDTRDGEGAHAEEPGADLPCGSEELQGFVAKVPKVDWPSRTYSISVPTEARARRFWPLREGLGDSKVSVRRT